MPNDLERDHLFSGSIPELYERYLVPMIFRSYADDLAGRIAELQPARVLEIACGTGVVTRALASRLEKSVAITATDLNQPMLDYAAKVGVSRPITWQQADALQLPFEDASFDVVVCQFGVMFFPDRPKGLAEMRRVLRPGGTLCYSVWDRIQYNEFALAMLGALAAMFPDDPPRFMERTPHGYHDLSRIRADAIAGGFTAAQIDTIDARSRAATARYAAIAYCQGTPVRNEIESRNPAGLQAATDAAEAMLTERFGPTNLDGLIRAHIITTRRSP